jgi:hypothetical protein
MVAEDHDIDSASHKSHRRLPSPAQTMAVPHHPAGRHPAGISLQQAAQTVVMIHSEH